MTESDGRFLGEIQVKIEEEEIPVQINPDTELPTMTESDGRSMEEIQVKSNEEEIPVQISTGVLMTPRNVKSEEEEIHVRIKEEEVPIQIHTGDFSNIDAPSIPLQSEGGVKTENMESQNFQDGKQIKAEVKEETEEMKVRTCELCKEEETSMEIGTDAQYTRIIRTRSQVSASPRLAPPLSVLCAPLHTCPASQEEVEDKVTNVPNISSRECEMDKVRETAGKGRSKETGQRKRQRMSKVWDHFKLKKKDNSVQCVHCKTDLAFHNSTTSMLQHLHRKHPLQANSSPTGPDRPSRSSSHSQGQRRVDSYVWTATSSRPTEAAKLTDSILNMIVTDMRPLSMVEDEGFQRMVSTLNPRYSLPSRTYFTKLMEKKYVEMKEKLKNTLTETDSIALTTDIWTSIATEAYLGVTCHFLGKDWKMESYSLTTIPLEDRHTAANIAEWLENVIAIFDVPAQKVKALVHDNGDNVVAAAKILKEKHGWASVRCAGHTLNLVVQSALKNQQVISKSVACVRCLVEHFKKSELACTKLKEKQQQMGTPQHMLLHDVSTRWNSTYHMIARLLEQRWPVTAALSDPEVTPRGKHHDLDLKPEQWSLIEELSHGLEPFEGATIFLSGQNYVALSALPQLVHYLKKSIQGFTFETASLRAYQAHVLEQITTRWQELSMFQPETESSNTALIAAALDPRFKKLKFLSAEESFKVQSTVQSMALVAKTKMTQPSQDEASSTREQEDNSATAKQAKDHAATSFLHNILGSSESSSSDEEDKEQHLSQSVQKEVLMYFGEHPVSKKENPLTWWKTNEGRYPVLAKVAKSFLCVPATSTPSAGIMASNRRASLSSDHMDMLTFLHSNRKMII